MLREALEVEFHDVRGLAASLAVDRLELHDLALGQRPEPFRLNRGMVNEELLARLFPDPTGEGR